MSGWSPSLRRVVHCIGLIVIPVVAVLAGTPRLPVALASHAAQEPPPSVQKSAPQAELSDAVRRAGQARSLRYSGSVEQTLTPRPVPAMIGQQDLAVTIAIEGDVQGPDRSRTTLTFDPGGVAGLGAPRPVVIVRDGDALYAEVDGARQPFRNDSLLVPSADDALAYLAAAENPRWLSSQSVDGVTYARIGFDLRGEALASQRAARAAARSGAAADVPEWFRQAAGEGELWLAPDGLPARQVVTLNIPRVSEEYHARLAMRLNFEDIVGAPAAQAANAARPADPAAAAAVQAPSSASPPASGTAARTLLITGIALAAAALYLAFHHRRPRAARRGLTLALAFILAATAPAQALAAEAARSHAEALPGLSELAGLSPARPAVAAPVRNPARADEANPPDEPPAAAELPAPLQAALPQAPNGGTGDNGVVDVCGEGNAADDFDGDSLSDLDEGCLGTDPYADDTDFDSLPDGLEVAKVAVGGKSWSLDPMRMDSNGDGLNDFNELPATPVSMTVNGVLATALVGTAPVNANTAAFPAATRHDWDGDGAPNAWDADNDGDGVYDARDLSPYGVGPYQDQILISSKGAGYKGVQYLEMQVQPQNPAHLRFGLTTFDWPTDDEGQMRNYEGKNEAPVRLQPFLEVKVNAGALPRAYGGPNDYGLLLRPSENKFYAPLYPVGDYGTFTAFSARMAFAPGELERVDLSARLVWFVQAATQELVGTVVTDTNGVTSTIHSVNDEPLLLNVYRGEPARLAGLQVTKSDPYEYAVMGQPRSPAEDQHLMGVSIGMDTYFIGAGTIPSHTKFAGNVSVLRDLETRFNAPGSIAGCDAACQKALRFYTPLTATLTVSRAVATHKDAAMRGLSLALNRYLVDNKVAAAFTPVAALCDDGDRQFKCASLLMALDGATGSASLDALPTSVVSGSQRVDINLADIPVARQRVLKLALYEHLDGGNEWRQLNLGRTLAVLHNRYLPQRAQLEPLYAKQGLNWETATLVLIGAYSPFLAGRERTDWDGRFIPPALYPEPSVSEKAIEGFKAFGDSFGGLSLLAGDIAELGKQKGLLAALLGDSFARPLSTKLGGSGGAAGTAATGKTTAWQAARPSAATTRTFDMKAGTAGARSIRGTAQAAVDRIDAWNGVGQIAFGVMGIVTAVAGAGCALNEENFKCDEEAMGAAQAAIATIQAVGQGIDMGIVFYNALKGTLIMGKSLSTALEAVKLASFGGVASVVGAALSIGLSLGEYFAAIDNMPQTNGAQLLKNQALGFLIASLVWAVITLILTFVPGVGQIIGAILGFLDILVAAITGGESSLSREVVKFFYSPSMASNLAKTLFKSRPGGPQDAERGMTDGNVYLLAATFKGFLTAEPRRNAFVTGDQTAIMDRNAKADLNPASVMGYYTLTVFNDAQTAYDEVRGGLNLYVDDFNQLKAANARGCADAVYGPSYDPDFSYPSTNQAYRSCVNHPVAAFKLRQGLNQAFAFRPQINYIYNTHSCYGNLGGQKGAFGCGENTQDLAILGDYETDASGKTLTPTAFITFYLDVLPATLDQFVAWNVYDTLSPRQTDEKGAPRAWNQDADYDGIPTIQEPAGFNRASPDTDGDGASDKYELDNGWNALLADEDQDGLTDSGEADAGTLRRTSDSDQDGLNDGQEAPRGQGASLAVPGWEVPLPSGKAARVFSDPSQRDADADGLVDSTERSRLTSPWAVNIEPTLDLRVDPFAISPDGSRQGVFVGPGDSATVTVGLGNFAGYPVTSVMGLCLPAEFASVTGGALSGTPRVPGMASGGACPGGALRQWNFASPNNLLFAEVVSGTLAAVVDPALAGASRDVSVTLSIPLLKGPVTLRRAVRVDNDAPSAQITSLQSGDIVRRPPAGATLIVGGVSSDATSWVTRVDFDPGTGSFTASITDAGQVNPFAFAWTLPADGLYTLRARASDYVGNARVGTPVTNVMVDGTPPTATFAWAGPAFVRLGPGSTLVFTGTASDNLSGLARVDVSVDGGNYQGAGFAPGLSSGFAFTWTAPSLELAQGAHQVTVRARDRAGNFSAPSGIRVAIDTQPPTSQLDTRKYANAPAPVLRAGAAFTLYGRADDKGNLPLPPSAPVLAGAIHARDSSPVWYGAESPRDVTGGVTLAWVGDINGDRRADFAAGMPAALDGRGRVNIVYGRNGDFVAPPDMQTLDSSYALFYGAAGAGIGQHVAPLGDVNRDGLNDLLIGDAANQRAFLIFGRLKPFGTSNELSQGQQGLATEFALPLAGGQTPVLAPAGDVNDDGIHDLLVGAAGGVVYLVSGDERAWNPVYDLRAEAAATFTLPVGGKATGVGDVNGDGLDDFAIAASSRITLYASSRSFVRRAGVSLPAPIASFATADPGARLAPLGDANGDGRADFAYSDGPNARIVLGRASGAWAASYSLPLGAGFMGGLGDVNADGRSDFMLLQSGGQAYLYYGAAGAGAPSVGAIIDGVSSAAAAPLGSGSDLNCDASGDLLILTNATPANPAPATKEVNGTTGAELAALNVQNLGATSFGFAGGLALFDGPASASNVVVDDDYCAGCANDGYAFGTTAFNSIQEAIEAVPNGGRVNVMPGVYAPFEIASRQSVAVVGVGGRAGAESVFVDGGGGPRVVSISNSNDARVSNLLLRNADVGVDLDSAGTNGTLAGSETNRIKLDRLIIHGFSVAGVRMTPDSTADMRRVTLVAQAGGGPHLKVTDSPLDANPPNKLLADALLFVPPPGAATFTWFASGVGSGVFTPPDPLGTGRLNFVDGFASGGGGPTAWTPASGSFIPRDWISFKDETRNVYYPRGGYAVGYHADRLSQAEAIVAPEYLTGGGYEKDVNSYRSIQAAILSGIKRIRLMPGVYNEAFYLADGVEIIGSGAEQTHIRLPAGVTRPLAQADGARAASLAGVSLIAPNGTAFKARSGADLALSRSILRDSAAAARIDGSATMVDMANLTIARNTDGVAATGNAPIRARNTAFAFNAGTALGFQSAAVMQVHQYNAYYQNGAEMRVDGSARSADGAGEISANPQFNNAAADDFRLQQGSPLINAGSPSDPSPLGTGGRADIGYAESGLSGIYVDPAYAPGEHNDGLRYFENAFGDLAEAMAYLGDPAQRARICAALGGCAAQIDVRLGPGTYAPGLPVVVPGGVRLLGSGAENTTIALAGGNSLVVAGSDVEVSGFTLTGMPAGVRVEGGDHVRIRRNIVRGNTRGVVFAGGASGEVVNNTFAGNVDGIVADGATTAVTADSNILAGHTGSAALAVNGGALDVRYSLFNANSADLADAADGGGNVLNADPRFNNPAGNDYRLRIDSPAVDMADPALEAYAGGGKVADAGYHELLAAPIALLLGLAGSACNNAVSGVARVDVAEVAVANASAPVTATLPGAWQAAALQTPNQAASNWTRRLVPAGDGLRRLYSRAADALGNQEAPAVALLDRFGRPLASPQLNLYDGAYYADATTPTVRLLSPVPFSRTIESQIELRAVVTDADPAGQFTAVTPYFVVNGDVSPARFDLARSSANVRQFVADLRVGRGEWYTITAHAADAVRHLGSSQAVTVLNTLNPDLSVAPYVFISWPPEGAVVGGPPTITVRGTVTWTHPLQRGLDVYFGTSYCEDSVTPVLDDPFADATTWHAIVSLSAAGPQIACAQAADANSVPPLPTESVEYSYDNVGPRFVALTPPRVISRSVVLAGTATDTTTVYLDRVELSGDNGANWAVISQTNPVSPNVLTSFTSAYTPAPGLDYVPVTVTLRAWDQPGNAGITRAVYLVDNVPPALGLPTFDLPPGSFVNQASSLWMSWLAPTDGSGVVTVTASFDQIGDTVPVDPVEVTSIEFPLDTNGTWYAHLSAVDPWGNRTTYHLGPWRVNLGQYCDTPQRNLSLDGVIDLAGGEWDYSAFLDDDERPFIASEPNGSVQGLYAAWDAGAFYVGWQGAQWGFDGSLWVYLATGGPGLTALISPTSPARVLPFTADMAVQVNGLSKGRLYRVSGGAWADAGPLQVAMSGARETELRAPFAAPLNAGTNVRMLAFGRRGNGQVWTAFPTGNSLNGAWAESYNWSPICSAINPSFEQPSAPSVFASLALSEPASAPYPPNANLRFLVTLRNYEANWLSAYTIVNMTGTAGLGFVDQTADMPVLCTACPANGSVWQLWTDVPPAPSENGVLRGSSTNVLTVTGRLAAALSGVNVVTGAMGALHIGRFIGGGAEARRTDYRGPDVEILAIPFNPRPVVLSGKADDHGGIGVGLVEVNLNGSGWRPMSGTLSWTTLITPGNVAGVAVQARATDLYGQVGPVQSVNVVVDNQGPQVAFTVPAVYTSQSPFFGGTAYDPPAGGPIVDIQVDFNGRNQWAPAFRPASQKLTYGGTITSSTAPWQYTMGRVPGDGVPYSVVARAWDAAGNEGRSITRTFILDNVPPAVTTTLTATAGVILRGTVTDGSGVRRVQVRAQAPNGTVFTETATLNGAAWTYTTARPLAGGTYSLRVFATDIHGNTSTAGPFAYVRAGYRVLVPVVARPAPGQSPDGGAVDGGAPAP